MNTINNLPVILIHRGHHSYVQCAINQAVFMNNSVIVISNCTYDNCINAPIESLLNTSSVFSKFYTPLSTLGDYELFCFQRWFILYEYMKNNNLREVFYIDSDVLLYTDVSKELDFFRNYIFTLVLKSVGCSSYFSFEGLTNVCDFMLGLYQNQNSYEFHKIASHFEIRQRFGLSGGVCDMTLLEYFGRYRCANGVGEMTFIRDGAVYDHNINDKDSFYDFDGVKKFTFTDHLPYCHNSFINKLVQFKSIHFQGGSKALMEQHSTYNK
jgi:hypothetical protein